MSPFAALSPLVRSGFALSLLLMCLCNIGSSVLAAVRKRYRFAALAAALFLPAYFMWQTVFDLSLSHKTGNAVKVSLSLGSLPWVVWLAVLAVLALLSAALLARNIRYDRTFITPGTIKRYLDGIPCGICCFRENGRVLFSNVYMNRLCAALTGEELLDGNRLRGAADGGIVSALGRVWRFSCRELSFDGAPLYEMIASDITDEYAKTEALRKDRAELSELNRELKEYYIRIDDTVRRREILDAKANIHDEMNRLMLSTVAADGGDTAGLDRIFPLWEKNALLLCREAEETAKGQAKERIEKLAGSLKVRLVWRGAPPDGLTEGERSLFYSAAQEAIVNAVKHAGADELEISFEKTGSGIVCRFENGGTVPRGEARFTGGLHNLSLAAKRRGATLTAETGERFTLSLFFPKNQPIG
ncbi:MAG: hypothetical protein IJS78_00635 [Clostridia bacterium]|nr:hypothetical protein [Clostridia bacterium]